MAASNEPRDPEEASTMADAPTQAENLPAQSPSPLAKVHVLSGRYRLQEAVGSGGMGDVYRAIDLTTQQPVAVKCLSVVGRRDANTTLSNPTVGRFRREFNVMVRLRHPNVTEVRDFGWLDSGQPFLVMEFVQGRTLSTALRMLHLTLGGSTGPEADTLERWHKAIWLQLCDALAFIHQNQMVHRDIKPGNIMLENCDEDQPGHLKLMDFGLASYAGDSMDLTKTGSLIGTASYIAPEQALGQPIDARTDLYALGVLMYEMSTGRPLFSAEQPWAVVRMHIDATPVPPIFLNPAIPAYINAIILNLLSKRPEQRFASADHVAEALRLKRMPEELAARARVSPEQAGLLGRESEFQQLRRACEQAWQQSHMQCAFVVGEAGLGKSYLLNALVTWAKQNQATVMSGVCAETAHMPYGAVAEALSTYLISRRQDKVRDRLLHGLRPQIARLVPEVAGSRQPEPGNEASPTGQSQVRLFGAVAQLVARITAHKPLLWIIDDAQWLGDDAAELLSFIAKRNLPSRLCIVLAQRPIETEFQEDSESSEAIKVMNLGESVCTLISLRPIDERGVRQLAQASLGHYASPNAIDLIVARADGNPLFIQELAHTLKVEHPTPEALASVTQTLHLPVSARITRVMANRLADMTEAQHQLMNWASISGREFNLDMLAQVAEQNADDWAALIDGLLRRQMLQEKRVAGREVYQFVHQQLRDVIYGRLEQADRKQMHASFAHVLEQQSTEATPADLEYHFGESDQIDKAVQYGLAAGERAREVYAHRDARVFYERVLARVAHLPAYQEQAAQAHFGLGETHFFQGHYAQARAEFEQVVALTQ